MRTLILFILVCVIAASMSGDVRADVVTRVVSESNGEIVLDFVSRGPLRAPVARVFVAIPPVGAFSVGFSAGPAERLDGPVLFAGGEPADSVRARLTTQTDTLRVLGPFPFRGVRLLYVELELVSFLPGTNDVFALVAPILTVRYDPAPTTNDARTADPLVRSLAVNENVFPGTIRSGGADPFFSLAPTWIKIPVSARGVYQVTGEDLIARGVNLQSINDPASMRLYSRLGLNQPRDYFETSGTWRPGNAMEEVAIVVEDGGEKGTFEPTDRIVFYGVTASDWADYYDPTAADTVFKRHTHAGANFYYLTWDGQLPGAPARVAQTDGPPGAAGDVTTFVERYRAERDLVQDFDYRGDGWLWADIGELGNKNFTLISVSLTGIDTSRPQTFRTVGLSKYASPDTTDPANLNDHTTQYWVRRGGTETLIGQSQWTTAPGQRYFENGVPIRHDGFFLANNIPTEFKFRIPLPPQNPNRSDFGYFAWFSLHYHRFLRAPDNANAIGFSAPDTTGNVTFAVDNFSSIANPYVFDVTDMRAPVRINGVSAGGDEIRFSADFTGSRRHFWVASRSGLRTPSGMQLYSAPVDLRAAATGPNMLIITTDAFRSAAERLRSHRLGSVPDYPNPRVSVVTTTEIFDNFSGGMPDPFAVRNYIKFLYENYSDVGGNPSLAYVALLGDANEDFRNGRSTQPDYVPTNLYFTRRTSFTFVTDEWFGHMDDSDQISGRGVLDIAIGRLPAASVEEANTLVNKVIAYETADTFGPWRKRAILVADDERQTIREACDTQFTDECERLANEFAAGFLEVRKVYLTEYDRISSIKPAARAAFLDEWNEGALIVDYIGHGSNRQMADEQVFVDADVTLLNNGGRLPVLLALSCTIGDFANYLVKSLSEKLLLRREGGVIATVTASRDTFANLNNRLNFALFDVITVREPVDAQPAIGVSLMVAKAFALYRASNDVGQEENDWKYNLLADPAMRLRVPGREIRFDMGPADTLVAGLRKTVRGAVYRDGVVDESYNGRVTTLVREPDVDRAYQNECLSPSVMFYRIPGGVIYQGTADVTSGRFEYSFRVPRSASRGPLAFISSYADDARVDAVVTLDSTLSLVSPTAADSSGLRPLDGAPRVILGFKSGLKTVKPGETLQAVVRDADGINILDTTNEGKQAILFDDLPVPIDANDFFAYDYGGTDTSGVLLFPLPDLDFGRHQVVYKVSDAFGQTALDTLVFDVTDPRDYTAEVLFNYPNPFTDETSFLVRLSDRASIRLDIFTVSGRRIRRIEAERDAGEVWIPWDGRDAHGAEIANGVYLYVATVEFADLDRPALELRGKLSRIR